MANDFKTPAVDWREINGATRTGDEYGRKIPPGLVDWSTSEGDMRKRTYRKSKYPGAFTQALVNDDGSSITEDTNALLVQVLTHLGRLQEEMVALNVKFQQLLDLD